MRQNIQNYYQKNNRIIIKNKRPRSLQDSLRGYIVVIVLNSEQNGATIYLRIVATDTLS